MRMRLLAAVVFSVAPVTLLPHDAVFRSTVQPVSIWDVLAVCILGLLGALYAGGTWQMGLRGAKQRRAERIAFWCGWTVMLAAVLPPLDLLAAQRFAAHMLQHELLMIVGVPLLIAGRPMATWLWALPALLRHGAGGMFQRHPTVGALLRLRTAPRP